MGKTIAPKGSSEAFIRAHTNFDADNCVLWPFRKNALGYGYAVVNGKQRRAHNWMCRIVHGDPPAGKPHCAHSCGNPSCVNPKHLRWASGAENASDRYAHGTITYGSKSGRTKLTEDDVLAIRAAGNDLVHLARKFGVSKGCIVKIRSGTRWPHLKANYA